MMINSDSHTSVDGLIVLPIVLFVAQVTLLAGCDSMGNPGQEPVEDEPVEKEPVYEVILPKGFPALALGEPFTVTVEAEGVTASTEVTLQATWVTSTDSSAQEVRASLTASNPRAELSITLPDEAWNILVDATAFSSSYVGVGVQVSGDSTLVPYTEITPDFSSFIPPLEIGDQWTFRVEARERGVWVRGFHCSLYQQELEGTSTWEVIGVDFHDLKKRTYYIRERLSGEMVQDSARAPEWSSVGPCGSNALPFSHVDTLAIVENAPESVVVERPYGHTGLDFSLGNGVSNHYAADTLRVSHPGSSITLVKNVGVVRLRYSRLQSNLSDGSWWSHDRLEAGEDARE